MADAKIGLTIHLLKPHEVATFDNEVKKGLQDIRPLAPPLDGEFIPLPSQPGEPPWVDAIRSVLQDPNGLTLDSQSPAGLLVVRRSGNTFVLSFLDEIISARFYIDLQKQENHAHLWRTRIQKRSEPDPRRPPFSCVVVRQQRMKSYRNDQLGKCWVQSWVQDWY
jgi:hypothetical protein